MNKRIQIVWLLMIISCTIDTFMVNEWWYSFVANLECFNNNPVAADKWYGKFLACTDQSDDRLNSYIRYGTFRIRTDMPSYMYKDFLYHLQKTNNIAQIIELMPLLGSAFEDDVDMQLLFAQALQQAGYQTAADQKFIQLLDKAKDKQEVALHASQIFLRRKEPENALQTIKDYLAHDPGNMHNFIFHFLQAQIYLMMDKKKEALEQIEKCLSLQPAFDKAWLLFALLHEQSGQLKNAIKGYTTFLELSTMPSQHIQEHLLSLVFKQKLLDAQEHQLQVDISCFDQALSFFKSRKYKEALQIIDKCLIKQPKDIDNKTLKIEILNHQLYKMPALALLEQSNRLASHEPMILKHLAKCYIKYGNSDTAIKIIADTYIQI